VSRFWLIYSDFFGRPLGVVILDSPSLSLARLQVTAQNLDQGATFCDGHELEGDSATLVPPGAIGRMLSLEEAGNIIRRLERWIPKRAAAASVKRRASVRRHAG
jgi:hypothetical protein